MVHIIEIYATERDLWHIRRSNICHRQRYLVHTGISAPDGDIWYKRRYLVQTKIFAIDGDVWYILSKYMLPREIYGTYVGLISATDKDI